MDDKEISEKFRQLKRGGYLDFITFHPSYSYEEFIEGITVRTEENTSTTSDAKYILKSGIFKNMCKRALAGALPFEKRSVDGNKWKAKVGTEEWKENIDKTKWKEIYEKYLELGEDGPSIFEDAPRFVLIIDEINRGDISKIFGELITLIERDKRLGQENELTATLPYSNDTFGVPPNLYIIGTMNTADRSIALVDVALRRRFGFEEMIPDFEILQEHIEKNKNNFDKEVNDLLQMSITALEKINQNICEDRSIGRDKQIGHSYLFNVTTDSDLIMVWQHEILPLLEEYFYADYGKINDILFGNSEDSEWIKKKEGIVGFKDIEDLRRFIEKINPDKNE